MDMNDIAGKIIAALGDGFAVSATDPPSSWMATIVDPSRDRDFGFTIRHQSREKRLVIRPLWPKSGDGSLFPYDHDRPDVSITVAESRDPGAIAREILRRFLPDYREAFARGAAQRDSRDDYNARRASNQAMFAALLGGTVRGEEVDVPMGDCDRLGYIRDFQVGAESVRMDFRSVPIGVAVKLLESWKSLG